MSGSSWPLPEQGPTPQRKPWLLPVTATLALVVLVSAGGLWILASTVFGKDSGVAQCEQFRDQAEGGRDSAGSTSFDEYRELRDTFEGSEHDDIRRAGVHWADVSWQISQTGERSSVRSAYERLWVSAIKDLMSACANHDVDIRLELPD
jgi:hypothetical protein